MSLSEVSLIDHMGTDLTVVNAARVSIGKKKTEFTDGDAKLIKFLADHNHWSPFGHCSVQFHIKAPVFVARQLVKHQIGLTWNEISRRYVDNEPEFYTVDVWRKRAEDKKQGSDPDNTIEWVNRGERVGAVQLNVEYHALMGYKEMIEAGVAPEQARMILPQSMMTEWYWSGTLMHLLEYVILDVHQMLRLSLRKLQIRLHYIVKPYFPVVGEHYGTQLHIEG